VRVTEIHLQNFKQFSELRVQIPSTARLVVLCGPNGSGKSSVFDALAYWRRRQNVGLVDPLFFRLGGAAEAPTESVNVSFDQPPADARLALHIRTAQRVTVEFANQGLQRLEPAGLDAGPGRLIEIDERVQRNFQRLVAASISALWSHEERGTPAGDIVGNLTGAINAPLSELLEGLTFEGPDDPMGAEATFRFSKGSAQRYPYKLLSGGEKAVFDLLLDVVANREALGSTVWCIDEPEVHVNAALHGRLLRTLLELIPEAGQLIIATHSAGFLAEARSTQEAYPEGVAFVDFGGRDFSQTQTLTPQPVSRAFWRAQLQVALGDIAGLVAPQRLVMCEGAPDKRDRPRARFDSRCLEVIFGDLYPDTAFVSVGNADDVVGDRMDVGATVEALVDDVQVVRLIDRDARSEEEVEDLVAAGHRVLRRRNIEGYLLDPEVLESLARSSGKPEKLPEVMQARDAALAESIGRGNAADDLKSASSHLVADLRKLLQISAGGNSPPAFLRDTLAPLVRPGTAVFATLHEDVFGLPWTVRD
jgi:predicted ATPase